jgi:prepilin-type N-terminal cleavage/methylation domain-containing protein
MEYLFHTRGMTLVEMIVVIAIYTMLLAVISGSVYSMYQQNAYSFAQANEIDHARRGINRFARDVREMTYAENGTFPIVVRDSHRFGFYSDIDKDNSVEYVEYQLATTTFYKKVYNPVGTPPVYNFATPDQTLILSEYVQNMLQSTSTFLYYDENGVLLNTGALLTDVRYIKGQLIVNIDPLRAPGEFMLRTGVTPRNLKDNL